MVSSLFLRSDVLLTRLIFLSLFSVSFSAVCCLSTASFFFSSSNFLSDSWSMINLDLHPDVGGALRSLECVFLTLLLVSVLVMVKETRVVSSQGSCILTSLIPRNSRTSRIAHFSPSLRVIRLKIFFKS